MTEALPHFLQAAKRSTYAAQGDDASVVPLLADSRQLEYQEDGWLYRDIYVGLLRFVGQELVYQQGRALWSMAYAGGVPPGTPDSQARTAYAFLRQALRALPTDFPVRGPQCLEEGGWRYTCHHSGTLAAFDGIESITDPEGAVVYQLRFAGGLVV